MDELHVQWMDLPDATDVLSFPMDELRSAKEGEEFPSGILGDIVLCPEFARKQAAEADRTSMASFSSSPPTDSCTYSVMIT